MAYSKLHSSIVNSSLWVEPDSTRLLFITLLAMCDRDGMVYGSRYGIARVANINPDEIDEAWAALLAPDPDSGDKIRAPENEGRRIEEVSGGFRLLNFEYYRGLRNEDDRRDQNRAAQARHKAKISLVKPHSAEVSHDKPQKAHTETDTEAEADTEKDKDSGAALRAAPPPAPCFDGSNEKTLGKRSLVAISSSFELPEEWGFDAEALGFKSSEILLEAEKFRQYWTAGKGAGKRRGLKTWRQSWSNWLAKAAERQ
jgi:hypothetical protein